VQPEDLVLNDAVVELKPSHADQHRAPPAFWNDAAAAHPVGHQEQADDDGGEPAGVEKPVGDQPHGHGRLVVEVVPMQQLVEERFVYEGG
jgi:hypothetical protein